MYAVYVFLFLVVFFLFAFTVLFAVGSLIGLASVGKEVLQAMSATREAKAQARPSRPAAQPGHPPAATPAEIRVEAGAVYAGA